MAKKKKASAKAPEDIGEPQPNTLLEGGEAIVIDGPSSGVMPVNHGIADVSQVKPQLKQNEPKVSPYSVSYVTFAAGPGHTVFYIPKHRLQSTCWSNAEPGGRVELLGVSPETGHTLAHYLHTDTYDVLSGKSNFDHAFRVFNLASRYNLMGLETLSTDQMRSLGVSMSICEILNKVRPDFSKLTGTSWLHRYLEERTKCQFELDRTIFNQDDFAQSIGRGSLNRYMMRLVVRLFTEAHTRMLEAERKLEINEEAKSTEIEEPPAGEMLQNCPSSFGDEARCASSPAVEMSFEFPSAASGVDDVISLSSHDCGLLEGPPDDSICHNLSEDILEEERTHFQAPEVLEATLEPSLPVEPTQAIEEIVDVLLSKRDKKRLKKNRLAMLREAELAESIAIPQTPTQAAEPEPEIPFVSEPISEEPTLPISDQSSLEFLKSHHEQSSVFPTTNPVFSKHEDVEVVPEPEPVVDSFAGLCKSQRRKLEKKMRDKAKMREQEQAEREAEERAIAEALAEEERLREEAEAARLAEEEAERIQNEERNRLEEEEAAAATTAAEMEEAERLRSEEERNAKEEAQFFQRVASEPSVKEKAQMLFERAIELDPLPPPPPPPPPPPLDTELLPEPAQTTEPDAVVDDPWSFSAFGTKKKKKNKKKGIIPEDEPVPEPDADPEPQPSTRDDPWGFAFRPKASFPGDLTCAVPEPPAPGPSVYNPWTFNFRPSAKKESVAVEEPPPLPEPEAVPEPENDPWAFSTTSKKKKKKKKYIVEEEPVPAPEQPEPEAVPKVVEDDVWGFGTTSKKKKKTSVIEEEPVPAPEQPVSQATSKAGDDDWGFPTTTSAKKKKKIKKAAIEEPLPLSETVIDEKPDIPSTDPPAPAQPIVDNNGWGSVWGVPKKTKKKTRSSGWNFEISSSSPPPPPPPAEAEGIPEPVSEAVAEPEPDYAIVAPPAVQEDAPTAETEAVCYEVADVDVSTCPNYEEPEAEASRDAEPEYGIECVSTAPPEPEVGYLAYTEPATVEEVETAALPQPEPMPVEEAQPATYPVDEVEISTYCNWRKIHMSTSRWRGCDKCSAVLKDMAKQWVRENES